MILTLTPALRYFQGCPLSLYSKGSNYYIFVEQLYSELTTIFQSVVTIQPYHAYCTAMERMLTSDTFLELFEDEANHKRILPLLHSFGVNLLLQAEKEYISSALLLNSSNPNKNFKYESYMNMSIIAAITSIFCHNNFEAEKVFSNQISRKQFRDLNQFGLAFDTCRYFKKNIPCLCLKDVYKRLKALPKMGECQTCRAKIERSKLFLCKGCKFNHYCGIDCQAAHFSKHREFCITYGT